MDDIEFGAVVARLIAHYRDRRLPRTLLQQKLRHVETITVDELAELAQQIYLSGRKVDLSDARFSIESFRNDVLHVLTDIQFQLVELFRNENKAGYMLVIEDQTVRWDKCPKQIKEYIDEHAAPA